MKQVLIIPFLFSSVSSQTQSSAEVFLNTGAYQRAYHTAVKRQDYQTASFAALLYVQYKAPQNIVWIDRAITNGKYAVKLAPQQAEAHLLLGSALGMKAELSGLSLTALNLAHQCRASYEKSLKLKPDLAEAQIALARWHSNAYAKAGVISGGNPNKARQLSIKALKSDPNNMHIVVQAAHIQLDLKNTQKAKALFKKSLSFPAKSIAERSLKQQTKETLAKLK